MGYATFCFVTRLAEQASRQVLTHAQNVDNPWSLAAIMDTVYSKQMIDKINDVILDLKNLIEEYNGSSYSDAIRKINETEQAFSKAWSGSWIGYHAHTYLYNFTPKTINEHFDPQIGLVSIYKSPTVGVWIVYEYDDVVSEFIKKSDVDPKLFIDITDRFNKIFAITKNKLLPIVDFLFNSTKDTFYQGLKVEMNSLNKCISKQDFISAKSPKYQIKTTDQRAAAEGLITPPHISIQCLAYEYASYCSQAERLIQISEKLKDYLELKELNIMNSDQTKINKIFIGHGRSLAWRDLKDFISERLKIEYEEFNRSPSAGMATKERLEQMLSSCTFAFLVMTAEDTGVDDKKYARSNVVHEIGLFQGRLGFTKAIILLEEGCEEFSNIVGLTQIRFPKDSIKSCFEEIRRVLERENIINP
ncbi:TIR domain-containing protein [Leptospira neocaledonica]|uniref:CD-NTase-associated protein 12/Pycsar effector protein TIR domain-containing protein n=1 Tax=Leptospira neocaledonica TaxID=2023192 RepID=A0A2M9ZTB1_9LEPT|nr:nucleotide-binding protein [Leptospira neocaledonica]PJZ75296.1 hypothetical protein CH365_19645 [Leptospira neocaledonica]